MRIFFFLSLFIFSVAQADPGVGFKGYFATNQLIRDRIMKPGSVFQLATYLGTQCLNADIDGNDCEGLWTLLGSYQGQGVGNRFNNGAPNGVNMLLWYVALDSLSSDLAKLCNSATPGPFKAEVSSEFMSALQPFCSWPKEASRAEESLRNFWYTVISFEAPEEEYLLWKEFVLGSDYVNSTASEVVQGMNVSILNNPYFLLKR